MRRPGTERPSPAGSRHSGPFALRAKPPEQPRAGLRPRSECGDLSCCPCSAYLDSSINFSSTKARTESCGRGIVLRVMRRAHSSGRLSAARAHYALLVCKEPRRSTARRLPSSGHLQARSPRPPLPARRQLTGPLQSLGMRFEPDVQLHKLFRHRG